MNRIDYIYPTALEQIKAAINGETIPSNDGNRDGMVNDVRYFSKAALDQIVESFEPEETINRILASNKLPEDGSVRWVVIGVSSLDPTDPEDLSKYGCTVMQYFKHVQGTTPDHFVYTSISKAQIDALYQRWVTYSAIDADLASLMSTILFVPVVGASDDTFTVGQETPLTTFLELTEQGISIPDFPYGFVMGKITQDMHSGDDWFEIPHSGGMGPLSLLLPGAKGFVANFNNVGKYLKQYYIDDADAHTFYFYIKWMDTFGIEKNICVSCAPTRPTPTQE